MPGYTRSRQSENFAEAKLASPGRASGAARDNPRQARDKQAKGSRLMLGNKCIAS